MMSSSSSLTISIAVKQDKQQLDRIHYRESNRHMTNYIFVLIASMVICLLLSATKLTESVPTVFLDRSFAKSREPVSLEEAFLGELRPKDFESDWSTSTSSNSAPHDQLIYEESKNILLADLLQPMLEQSKGLNLSPSILLKHGDNLSAQATTNIRNDKANEIISNGGKPGAVVLVSNTSLLTTIEFQGYKISPTKRYLLLWNSRRKQFRHSATARYFLYDIKLDLITILSTRQYNNNGHSLSAAHNESLRAETDGADSDPMRFQTADWYSSDAPGGGLVESLILIQNNDLYKLHDVSRLTNGEHAAAPGARRKREAHEMLVQLTRTGREGVIFNGIPDWLYEEEILSSTPAFQVSPSSNYLAYMSFDDSHVNIMPFTVYGDRIIPRVQLVRYPKAGQPNPRVTVHVVDNFNQVVGGGGGEIQPISVKMPIPDELAQEQHYINRINWLTSDKLAVVWSSRNQSNSFIVICSRVVGWRCEKNLALKAENGWLDIGDDLQPLDSEHYLAIIPKFEGPSVGYFRHVAKVSLREPNKFVFLTGGPREVLSFDGVDFNRSLVYYTSTVAGEPGQRHLFVVDLVAQLTNNGGSQNGDCVTCEHYPNDCLYNYVKMSPSTNYYMFHCSGPGIPRVELRATRHRTKRNLFENLVGGGDTKSLKSTGGTALARSPNESSSTQDNNPQGQQFGSSLIWTYEDNRRLRDKLENRKMMPTTLRLRVPIHGTDYKADVLLLIPPQAMITNSPQQSITRQYLSLDQVGQMFPIGLNSGQHYPMVVDVYGGPGSQKVDYRFSVNLGHYLTTSKQMVYAMIDGRGSGFQGTKRLFELYHRLGTVEIRDQIDVASQLARALWFVDPGRVAIWGWSYGGYAAAMSLAQSKQRANQYLNNNPILTQNKTDPSATSESVFKCAASVAPVTNWIYYDTAYTERFMSSPWANEKYDNSFPGDHQGDFRELPERQHKISIYAQNNQEPRMVVNKWTPLSRALYPSIARAQRPIEEPEAPIGNTQAGVRRLARQSQQQTTDDGIDLNERYRKASLLENCANIESDSFLLVHGTADDNVNFQQSIMLMKRLIKKNILFETRLYPDQDHGIAEKADKLHLGSTLTSFLVNCLG